jgi:hypothetical protein
MMSRFRLKYPANCNWPTDPKTRRRYPPDQYFLIRLLSDWSDDRRLVDYHAGEILFVWNLLRIKGKSLKISGDSRKGYKAAWQPAENGLAKDLKRLERAARSRSLRVWLNACAGVSAKARRHVEPIAPHVIERTTKGFRRAKLRDVVGFSTTKKIGSPSKDGDVVFDIVVLKSEVALPLIQSAIGKLEEIPKSDRSKRRRDPLEEKVRLKVEKAFEELTGKRARRNIDPDSGRQIDKCHLFGRQIDRHFKTAIYAATDSSRGRPLRTKPILK